jgi:hypothetical protein
VKKVWYALGAAGLAPAVGLAIPATTAAAAVHPPKAKAKAVSLQHVVGHETKPDLTCGSAFASYVHDGDLRLGVFWSSFACIHGVQGILNHRQVKLDMRTRIYSYPGGPRVYSNYVGGYIPPTQSYTGFSKDPNVYGEQVCIALVESSHHSHVDYGPTCWSY